MFDMLRQELAEKGSVRFYIRAVPNASETKVLEIMEDESVKIAVAAPAEKGKANRELVRFLSKKFGKTAEIVSGHSSRLKLVWVG